MSSGYRAINEYDMIIQDQPNDKEYSMDEREKMVAKIESLGACSVVWFLTEVLEGMNTNQLAYCHNAIVNEFDLDVEDVDVNMEEV